MKRKFALTLALPLMLLSACEEEAAPDADSVETGGEVAGDVLEGTISDDMLPLEELTSASPPAERTDDEEGATGDDDEASEN